MTALVKYIYTIGWLSLFVILPHELASKFVLPTVRAMVARRLVTKYQLTQEEVAKRLGVTQAAVSNYLRGKRAKILHLGKARDVREATKALAGLLAEDKHDEVRFMTKMTAICNHVVETRLLCGLHHTLEPSIDPDACHACDAPLLTIENVSRLGSIRSLSSTL